MTRSVLDTSVLIGPEPALDGELAISAVTLGELHFGVLWAPTPEARAVRLHKLTTVERTFQALVVDDRVARSYGMLAALLRTSGRSPRPRAMDLLIAATAHAHGARLVTRNPKDLVGLEGVIDILAA